MTDAEAAQAVRTAIAVVITHAMLSGRAAGTATAAATLAEAAVQVTDALIAELEKPKP